MKLKKMSSIFKVSLCGAAIGLGIGFSAVVASDVSNEGVLTAEEEEITFAAADREAALADIAANRESVIDAILARWDADPTDDLAAGLEAASDEQLLAIEGAGSYDQVRQVLRGKSLVMSLEEGDLGAPLGIGDATKDYVYTPVVPCRILNTKLALGAIPGGTSRAYNVGDLVPASPQIPAQGGNPAGCPFPLTGGSIEPRAVHLNVTAVPLGNNGNLRVFPYSFGVPTPPNASLVNFRAGINIANAATIQSCDFCGPEIYIYASQTTHVVADVLGYYYDVDENVGLDYTSGGTEIAIGHNTYTTERTIRITHPESGYVSCLATGHSDYDVANSSGRLHAGWTASTAGTPVYPVWAAVAGASTGTYVPFAAHNTFPVSGSGTTNFYLRVRQSSGSLNDLKMYLQQATCTYIENRY